MTVARQKNPYLEPGENPKSSDLRKHLPPPMPTPTAAEAPSSARPFTPHRFQKEAHTAPNRFILILSGIQGGKTICGAIWLSMRIDEDPNSNYLITAPTYKILQQSTLPKFFELFPQLQPYYHKQENVIKLPDAKGTIFIRSADEPKALEGMTIRAAWLDEAGQMKSDVWLYIQGRLSILQGRAILTTTPYNMGWLYHDFFKKSLLPPSQKTSNTDYYVVKFRSVDNPYFPREEYERARATLDPKVFSKRYEGEFTRMEGLVYDDFDEHNIIQHLPDDHGIQRYFAGVDWGYTHAAAIIIVGAAPHGQFYVVDEYYRSGKTTAELVEIAKNLAAKYKISRWYADGAEPDRIEEFRRNGLYTLPAIKDRELGINKVRQLFREKRLLVHRTCINLLDEINRYHYPEPKSEVDINISETPAKEYDDACDALRYALATYQPEFSGSSRRPIIIRKGATRRTTGSSIAY